jgi:glutaredoxin
MTRVTLYTRPGCHLCEQVELVIRDAAIEHPIDLELRNILDDSSAYLLYRYEIPVVMVDGQEIARHTLSHEQLIRALGPA